jgi:hypothetical protein
MTSTSKALTIAAALALVAAAPAAAQTDWIGVTSTAYADDYRTSYAAARRAAHDNGYRDGVKRGEQAARGKKPFNAQIEREYRDAENGYNRSYGDRNRYRDDYRGGFAQGYRDGYEGRGKNDRGWGYGGNAGYGAFQNGVSDGYSKAREDLDDRRSPDPTRHKWYRSGDHDYEKSYGSKDAYKVDYRRGFAEGYDRAMRAAGIFSSASPASSSRR